ncbi:serine/threonine-protein kinase GCN2 [Pyrus ussuriensis x Pyrus communis]|uniref:Serine/threonine-protein kinase GCN2 n=1 Tax=Pyrus ussuriensis x Pyrus communis TaxID=2448454 RepID=A0A5N5IDT4_9ROSA|nr:serine/threonine-protein kinase GCN2 [Pyrus ussuriensis x Pyrus communis]
MSRKKCQIFKSNETTPLPNTTILALSRFQAHKKHLNAQNQTVTKKVSGGMGQKKLKRGEGGSEKKKKALKNHGVCVGDDDN